MKLQSLISYKLLLYSLIPVLFSQSWIYAQPVNPQPGENIWHLMAQVGTEVDQIALAQNSCCVGTFTTLDSIESKIDAIQINTSCDLSGTYTLLNASIAQDFTTQSKVDALANTVNADFAGTFTAIESIVAGSCDLSGTYTLLNTAIAQELITQSKVDALTTIVNADFAGTFTAIAAIPAANFTGTYTLLNTSIAQEFTTQSKLDLCCATLNSKVDALNATVVADFAGTFTSLASIRQEETVIESKVDALTNIVNADFAGTFTAIAAIPAANFTGTYTLLNTAIAQGFTTQSKLDLCCNTISSKLDVLSGIVVADFAGTFTALANIRQEETTIESKIDALTNIVNADFAGTFTVLAASTGCNFTGTYTMLQALGQCNATPLLLTSAGTTISTSGVYCLISSVTLGSSNTIAINAQDVVLDLNQKTVYGGASANNIAINNNRITVRNGFMSPSGASAIATTASRSYILLENITITGTLSSQGVSAQLSSSIVRNITTRNLQSGFALAGSSNCLIEGCNTFATSAGFSFSSGGPITLKNCSTKGASIGYDLSPSNEFLVDACYAEGGSTGFSAYFTGSQTVTFVNCIADNTQYGYQVYSSSPGLGSFSFNNCIAARSQSAGAGSGGFQIWGSNGVLESCTASNGNGSGFILNNTSTGASKISLNNCMATSNGKHGFDLALTASCSLNDCVASNNGINAIFGSGSGFNLDGAVACSLTNCQADGNAILGFDGSAAGSCCAVGDCYAFSNTYTGFAGNENIVFFNNFAYCNADNYNDSSASSAESGKLDSKVDALAQDLAGTFTVLATLNAGGTNACAPISLTIPSSGTTISSPGIYCLTNSVYTGANSITIDSNNVILDLNNYTVSGDSIIIQLSPTVTSNITIQNGTILGGKAAAQGVAASGNSLDHIVIKNIEFNNGSIAINFDTVTITESFFTDIHCVNFNNNNAAIYISGSTNNLTFTRCVIDSQAGLGGGGISLLNATIVTSNGRGNIFSDCVCRYCDGVSFNLLAVGVILKNCHVYYPQNTGFSLQNGGFSDSVIAVFENCSCVSSSSATINNFDTNVSGLYFKNCMTDGGEKGFHVVGNLVQLLNCSANNTTQTGFDMDSCGNFIVQNCTASQSANIGFNFNNCAAGTITGCLAAQNITGYSNSSPFPNLTFFANAATNNQVSYSSISAPPSAPIVQFASATTYGANIYDN